jgi:GGDEF domain-containing protein
MHTDISLRKKFEEDIRKLAFFDPLTQLPNRRLLLDRLQQLSALMATSNSPTFGQSNSPRQDG